MISIKGTTVKLHTLVDTGAKDDFNAPIYIEQVKEVENVIIEPSTNDAVTSEFDLYGKHLAYTLHIPKTNDDIWTDSIVELPSPWNKTVRTYGDEMVYDALMTPLSWNRKVKAEIYE